MARPRPRFASVEAFHAWFAERGAKVPDKKMSDAEWNAWLEEKGLYEELAEMHRQQEEERLKDIAEYRKAEAPLLEELRAAGCEVQAVQDLIPPFTQGKPKPSPFPQALPILAEHLSKPHPEMLKSTITRALGAPEAKFAWSTIVQEFKAAGDDGLLRDMLANTIAAITDDELLGETIALARDRDIGPSRVLLLCALERSKDPRARAAIEELAEDPDLKIQVEKIRRRWASKAKRQSNGGAESEARPTQFPKPKGLVEASMNFDLEHVSPFLRTVAGMVSGFGKDEINQIESCLPDMELDQEIGFSYWVRYGSDETPLHIIVFMDDIDAPDLYFYADPDLAGAIQEALSKHAEALGI